MTEKVDYSAVREFWDIAATDAASASYMAHEQGLPQSCVEHRFERERTVVDSWFDGLAGDSSILDIGCGAGAWTTLFAQRYQRVVGVDMSPNMLAAARANLADATNVELIEGNALLVPIEGSFDAAFVGGMLMYLNRADAVALLKRLRLLVSKGPIVLRETTVRNLSEVRNAEYHVIYRTPTELKEMAAEAGLVVKTVERNSGYADMEVAVELVNTVRRIPALARRDPDVVGKPLWRALAMTKPLTLDLLPRAVEAVGIAWPHLTNHFMLLEHN
ncbi:MAG: class I SAM-dependent methyltransferase [Acidimicrobiales bacterium]